MDVLPEPLGTDPTGVVPSRIIVPRNLGSTFNNWLGRSQFVADPYFNGALDDFRIYDRALGPAHVAELYATFQ